MAAVSLAEAETLRRILHLRQDAGGHLIDGHHTAIALRSLPAGNVPHLTVTDLCDVLPSCGYGCFKNRRRSL